MWRLLRYFSLGAKSQSQTRTQTHRPDEETQLINLRRNITRPTSSPVLDMRFCWCEEGVDSIFTISDILFSLEVEADVNFILLPFSSTSQHSSLEQLDPESNT